MTIEDRIREIVREELARERRDGLADKLAADCASCANEGWQKTKAAWLELRSAFAADDSPEATA
jgi:hypothetical protein